MQEPNILLVEDEESIAVLVKYNLEKNGFRVFDVSTVDRAFEVIENKVPDLILMDWMLPQQTGIEAVKEIKELESLRHIPVIMLTAKSQEEDKLKGFEVGVDDYITKPFSPKELVARVKSVLKRSNPNIMEENLSYKSIVIDNSKKAALLDGAKLDLSHTEYYLLSFLVKNAERVQSRDKILNQVWERPEEIEGRAVDVCIRRVRAALEKARPGMEAAIKTIRGEGYLLEID